MLSHFKSIVIAVFAFQVLFAGTQFLSIPTSAYDLIYFNSPWRNPAVLNHINKVPELGLAYGNWLAGIQNMGFKWRGQIGQNSGGLDLRYVGLSDLELRSNKPTSKPLGYYSAYGISARGITSREIGAIKFGLALQLIELEIYQESSRGVAFDFGATWSINEYFKFNISALNFGRMNKLESSAPELPKRLVNSVSFDQKSSSLFIGIESNSLLNDMIYYVGGNSKYKNLFFGGTATSTKGMKSISGGVGFLLGIYTITYGFQWGDHHLGRPQMLDISIRLP
ncbi:MAG: hypothetical protein HOG33_02475 [Candidatus Marinimicrobia bacterium]|jgi:hypothetical protein|nr:hypothetical protein [Candidatus Neomarinimicrobiota bacterium]MBT3795910.1 hypothetical protein [Candidatus Neomarinimicrobiota bacterium]MBT4149069.1 hypothetical protein [Candidatus Neomarinimicrobiota bacterium]MBT4785012.1 hypothetical protein [Candidatus Neomarinimicrobiota bacterium]MBT7423549.1 hypothetical protein [Candidatus Neomarinimicrobiota bacterium]|tara:strand:- start:1486 stop:2328 length:843 start_codon:yes stop_codon:yes gene_type:complete